MLLDMLFPPSCIYCSKVGNIICTTCKNFLQKSLPVCVVCGKLSNGYLTHTECFSQCRVSSAYSQWIENDISKKIDTLVLSNKSYNIYNSLLDLITEEYILNMFNTFHVGYLSNRYKEANEALFKVIIKRYPTKKNSSKDLLLVGYKLESVKELYKQTQEIKDYNINIFLLFTESPHL